VIAVKKREHDYNIENELKQLTCPDDETIEKIAEEIPVLDDAAKERILKLCERKMDLKMNKDIKKDNIKRTDYDNSDTVKGVEKYNRPKWYRPVMSTAASLLVVAGIGGAIALKGNLKPEDPMSESTVSDEIEASLCSLVEDNFYCLENVLFFGSLPHKDVTLADGTWFEVNSEKFPDYAAFEKYMYSVYSDDIADFYLTSYPSGAGAYVDVDGTLAIMPGIVADGQTIDVDFTDFDIANISENDGTYSFDVLADIKITDTTDESSPDYQTLEDALIGFEAKTEDDGIRLTGMYGHDTATRFVYSNPVEGSRGYIDTPWQESYLELIDHLDTIYNSDGEEVNNTSMYFKLIYPEGHDIPLFGVVGGVADSIVLLYQIIDGHTYLVDDTTPYEELTGTMYSHSEMIQYLENALGDKNTESSTEAVTEDNTEIKGSAVSEEDTAKLENLVSENFYCMENVFRFGHLPYDSDTLYNDEVYKVESEEFTSFEALRDFIFSVYTYEIADYYFYRYPIGKNMYTNYYNDDNLYIRVDSLPDGNIIDVDFMDFEIANASVIDGTYSFDVLVDVKITDTTDVSGESIYNQTLEDALIGFEAKKDIDGNLKLTGMYGHDVVDRFVYNNPVEGTRGYIDTTWQETYTEFMNTLISYNEDTEFKLELFNITDKEAPMLYVYPTEPDQASYIYCIIDGEIYNLKTYEGMLYYSFVTQDGHYVGYNIGDNFLSASFYDIDGHDIIEMESMLYRDNTCYINGEEASEADMFELFYKYGISTFSLDFTTDELYSYLDNGIYNNSTDNSENNDTTENTVITTEFTTEITELFDKNLQCLELYRSNPLPTVGEPLFEGEEQIICEISSDKFSSYDELVDYVNSTYTYGTAQMYLNDFPYEGNQLYLEYDGKFCLNTYYPVGGKGYYVDWSDYSIEITDADDTTCTFNVTATIQEPGDLPAEEYTLSCEAIITENGWRLIRMYF